MNMHSTEVLNMVVPVLVHLLQFKPPRPNQLIYKAPNNKLETE